MYFGIQCFREKMAGIRCLKKNVFWYWVSVKYWCSDMYWSDNALRYWQCSSVVFQGMIPPHLFYEIKLIRAKPLLLEFFADLCFWSLKQFKLWDELQNNYNFKKSLVKRKRRNNFYICTFVRKWNSSIKKDL